MKFLYISDTTLPSAKANSVNITKMCEALTSYVNELTLIFPVFDNNIKTFAEVSEYYGLTRDFKVHCVKVPNIPGALYLYAVKVAFIVFKHFSINKESTYVYGRSPAAISLLSFMGYPSGIDVHGKVWTNGIVRSWLYHYLSRSPAMRLISFNSSQLQDLFLKRFTKTKPIKTLALPNGASLGVVNSKYLIKGSSNTLRVGYVGSLMKGRGVELIVNLAKRMPYVEFHLAGGPISYIEAFDPVAKDCSNLHLYGQIPYSDTASFLTSCDILLAPYQLDTSVGSGENTVTYMSPIKIFEYMASRRAIIASDLPALNEIIGDKNSIFVASDDVKQWENAIHMLQDSSIRSKLAQRAYERWQSNFTWDIRGKKVFEFLTGKLMSS